jgi:hypothetical protein
MHNGRTHLDNNYNSSSPERSAKGFHYRPVGFRSVYFSATAVSRFVGVGRAPLAALRQYQFVVIRINFIDVFPEGFQYYFIGNDTEFIFDIVKRSRRAVVNSAFGVYLFILIASARCVIFSTVPNRYRQASPL